MKDRHGGPDGPEDVDAAFAEIIADLEREGFGSSFADDPEPADDKPEQDAPDSGPDTEQMPATRPTAWRGSDTDWDWTGESDDDHYVPPDPPPLPRLRPVTILAIVVLALGLVLMVVPGLFGLVPRLGTPIALIAIGVGIVLLLLRVRNDPARDRGEDDDNGAQV